MNDLVERLCRGEPCREGCGAPCRTMDAASGCVCAEAADRIAQLEAALRPFACECVGFCKDAKHNYGEVEPIETCKYGRNRAALGEERT